MKKLSKKEKKEIIKASNDLDPEFTRIFMDTCFSIGTKTFDIFVNTLNAFTLLREIPKMDKAYIIEACVLNFDAMTTREFCNYLFRKTQHNLTLFQHHCKKMKLSDIKTYLLMKEMLMCFVDGITIKKNRDISIKELKKEAHENDK